MAPCLTGSILLALATEYVALFLFILYLFASHQGSPSAPLVIPVAVYATGRVVSGLLTGWLARIRGALHGVVIGAFAVVSSSWLLQAPATAEFTGAYITDMRALRTYVPWVIAPIALSAVGGKLGEKLRRLQLP
jgi:hypothetical protein